MDTQYAFRIDIGLLAQLKDVAKEQDLSLPQIFRKMAREYVADHQKSGVQNEKS